MAKEPADLIHPETLSPWMRRLIRTFAHGDPLLAAGLRMVLCGETVKEAARMCALERHALAEKSQAFIVCLKELEAEEGLDPFDLVVEQPMDAKGPEKAPPGYTGRMRSGKVAMPGRKKWQGGKVGKAKKSKAAVTA